MSNEDGSKKRSKSLSGQISALGDKINRALSREKQQEERYQEDDMSTASTIVERTTREVWHSSGRGGLGNFKPNVSADLESNLVARGRDTTRAFSTGRGGAGNIISPKDDTSSPQRPVSSPNTSRSRSRGGNAIMSTGRGGVGNILRQNNPYGLDELSEIPVERGRSQTKSSANSAADPTSK